MPVSFSFSEAVSEPLSSVVQEKNTRLVLVLPSHANGANEHISFGYGAVSVLISVTITKQNML